MNKQSDWKSNRTLPIFPYETDLEHKDNSLKTNTRSFHANSLTLHLLETKTFIFIFCLLFAKTIMTMMLESLENNKTSSDFFDFFSSTYNSV